MRAGAERSGIGGRRAFPLSHCSVWGHFQLTSGLHPVKVSSGSLLSRFVSKTNFICRLCVGGERGAAGGSGLNNVQSAGKFPLLHRVLQGGRPRGTDHLSNLPLVLKSRPCHRPVTGTLSSLSSSFFPHLPSTLCFQKP